MVKFDVILRILTERLDVILYISRADCDAPCFEQLKATHLRASPKQKALLDVLLQLIKTWPLTIGPWKHQEFQYSTKSCIIHFVSKLESGFDKRSNCSRQMISLFLIY